MAADADRAVLFADLVGSTRLYESLGDREAHAIVAGRLGALREAVERFAGTVVKSIGDGLLATFLSADAALRCAEAIVADMRRDALGSDRPLGVHVGFHFGSVIEANGDVFGDTVNVAARVMQLAENQRVFTTGSTADHLCESLHARLRPVGRVAIRGRRDPVDLFELATGYETLIQWADLPREEATKATGTWLKILCGDKEHVLRGAGGLLTIGRDATNDVVLRNPLASRFHARVERRPRGWYLVDRSSNGTLVVPEGGRPTRLRREDARIEGSGSVHVACSADAQLDEPIRYELSDLETS
jgi:adenylate cyclase